MGGSNNLFFIYNMFAERTKEFGSVAGEDLPTFADTKRRKRRLFDCGCKICGVEKLHISGKYRGHYVCRSCVRVHQSVAFGYIEGKPLPVCTMGGK